jgi:hypothetical protein
MHYFRKPKLWSTHYTPLDPKWCLRVFRCILLTFSMWKLQNFCLSLNALFCGTKVVKHPFQSIGPKMMFGRVSEHFTNLQHVKRWKLVCSGLHAIFWGAKLWSLQSSLFDPKWRLGVFHCISLTLCTLKDAKLVFKPDCNISGYQSCESSVLVQWTQDDVWECFGAYC